MAARKKTTTLADELRALMERGDIESAEGATAREQMLLSVLRKAVGGDLKSVEFVLELLGEQPRPKGKETQPEGVTVRLGPGVEELCR